MKLKKGLAAMRTEKWKKMVLAIVLATGLAAGLPQAAFAETRDPVYKGR